MSLESLLDLHNQLCFPAFPENDGFAEWVEDLIETDSYYVGLASSTVAGEKVEVDFSHLIELKDDLNQYSETENDGKIYRECVEYIRCLERLATAVSVAHN